jgi:hypothetical protein
VDGSPLGVFFWANLFQTWIVHITNCRKRQSLLSSKIASNGTRGASTEPVTGLVHSCWVVDQFSWHIWKEKGNVACDLDHSNGIKLQLSGEMDPFQNDSSFVVKTQMENKLFPTPPSKS